MKRNIHNDTLIQQIQAFGSAARDHRQIQKRLLQVLPDRLKQLISKQTKGGSKPSLASRQALLCDEFLKYLDEIVDVSHKSLEARIQYETHMMMFNCRKSLNRRHRF